MFIILSNEQFNTISLTLKLILEKNNFKVNIINKLSENNYNHNAIYIILYYDEYNFIPKKYIFYHLQQEKLFFLKNNAQKILNNSLFIWESTLSNNKYYKNIECVNRYFVPLPYYYKNNINNYHNNKYDICVCGFLNKKNTNILKTLKKKYNIIDNIDNIDNNNSINLFSFINNSKIILYFYNDYFINEQLHELLDNNLIIITEIPNKYDYQNKLLYDNLIIYYNKIKDNMSNINILYDKINYYLNINNYNEYITKIKNNKIILENQTHNIFLQNLNNIFFLNKSIIYTSNNNIFEYIKYSNILLPTKIIIDKMDNIYSNNYINIDVNLYKYINKINLNFKDTLSHINSYGIENGLIYHSKQILNLFPNSQIYIHNNHFFINNNIELRKFVNINIYNKSYNNFMEDFFELKETNIKKNEDLLILVFIGNEIIGLKLLDKIIKSKKKYIIGICFNNYNIYLKLKNIIIKNFDNYSIGISRDFGNDIIPTLIMYKKLIYTINFKFIIKLHTKSNNIWFNDLTDYLLNNNLENEYKSNCVCNPKYYLNIYDIASFEYKTLEYLKKKYSNYFNKHYFAKGSIFFCKKEIFDCILLFIEKNNYRQYFTNNMYDSNIVNISNSPIHFIERLFGIINF